MIILNLLLLLNISEQEYSSCSVNNDNNNFDVLMGCRRKAGSLGSVDWELCRTCKHESTYNKYQTPYYHVMSLDPIIKEMRVLVKYTKEEGRFTVAKKKVHAKTSALAECPLGWVAAAITALKDPTNFSCQAIIKYIKYKVGTANSAAQIHLALKHEVAKEALKMARAPEKISENPDFVITGAQEK